MQKFLADDLKRFLVAVDRHLSEPFELVVIGGSAAMLAYSGSRATRDIDTRGTDSTRIDSAFDAARRETGLEIPVEHAGVAEGPYELESRLRAVDIPGLRRLVVKVPEEHDLVLMKTLRGEEPDLQAAEEIHARRGLEPDVLIDRYVEEMKHCTGEPRRLDLNFLVLIERLYGAQERETAEKRIRRMRG